RHSHSFPTRRSSDLPSQASTSEQERQSSSTSHGWTSQRASRGRTCRPWTSQRLRIKKNSTSGEDTQDCCSASASSDRASNEIRADRKSTRLNSSHVA